MAEAKLRAHDEDVAYVVFRPRYGSGPNTYNIQAAKLKLDERYLVLFTVHPPMRSPP